VSQIQRMQHRSQRKPSTPNNQQRQLGRMRWFLLVTLVCWTFAVTIGLIVMFCITKSSLALPFFSTLAPPAYLWYRCTKYLFPLPLHEVPLHKEKRMTAHALDNDVSSSTVHKREPGEADDATQTPVHKRRSRKAGDAPPHSAS
jgi:hypothetical protein